MKIITFEIPVLTPMLNTYVRMHWSKQRQHTKDMAWLVWEAVEHIPAIPFKKCRVKIERIHKPGATTHDWDGLLGGMKGLLDAMTSTHKAGCGLIEDDSTDCIVEIPEVVSRPCVRGESPRTVVTITDLT
jgi:hypothetical protein